MDVVKILKLGKSYRSTKGKEPSGSEKKSSNLCLRFFFKIKKSYENDTSNSLGLFEKMR